ncbi:serine/threonine-protein phosphatase 4 regulatory subunit 2-like isoform X2 [Phoenix dactylifera]|uniref:Serine/threonine-protein phosphatase 4 regulatory subunit 2-like isoform X2 n=1 Tax=Phoenix dactylifera TaxID=42345 RepID=A0A8B8ZU56_PHODC|nr:serine/threonine-protein phosphatase 4 regulatory subunit 2-like isoform X2 [Phoenix dactylifera]
MENPIMESPQSATFSSTDVDHHSENMIPHHANDEEAEPKCDVSVEEIRSIMQVIAATGKFWHDWDMLKSLLSFQLKQVWGALLSFVEGPPFTLQRLCEILLNPKGTYTNLSKLALALQKNLLVTSTLTMCTDPYPTEVVQKPDEPDKASEVPCGQTDPVPNGVETVAGDGDEEMTDAEADETTPNTDTEMQEEKVTETSDSDSELRSDANPSQELCTRSEEQNP